MVELKLRALVYLVEVKSMVVVVTVVVTVALEAPAVEMVSEWKVVFVVVVFVVVECDL